MLRKTRLSALYKSANCEKKIYVIRLRNDSFRVENQADRICIWKTYGLFLGRLPEFGPRRQAAAALCVGLDGDIEISADEKTWYRCRTAMTGPEVDHAIRFFDRRCALLFLEPNTDDFARLKGTNTIRAQNGIFTALSEETYLLDFLHTVAATQNPAALQTLLDSFAIAPGLTHENPVPDARMQNIAQQVAQESAENIPVEKLAAALGISVSSLEHQFKSQIGVPIRMFRTWFRLKAAILQLKEGLTLTEAALRAGFFDSAHFTRTFKEVFGLPPSEIFNARRRISWHVSL